MYAQLRLFVEGVGDSIIGTSKVPTDFVTPGEAEGRIAGAFNLMFTIGMILAVAFVIKGGIDYIMSSGDSGKVKLAQAEIQYAIIGLVIALSGYLIVTIVTNTLGFKPEGLFN